MPRTAPSDSILDLHTITRLQLSRIREHRRHLRLPAILPHGPGQRDRVAPRIVASRVHELVRGLVDAVRLTEPIDGYDAIDNPDDRRLAYVNHSFASMLGYETPQELLGDPIDSYVHVEDRPILDQL